MKRLSLLEIRLPSLSNHSMAMGSSPLAEQTIWARSSILVSRLRYLVPMRAGSGRLCGGH